MLRILCSPQRSLSDYPVELEGGDVNQNDPGEMDDEEEADLGEMPEEGKGDWLNWCNLWSCNPFSDLVYIVFDFRVSWNKNLKTKRAPS